MPDDAGALSLMLDGSPPEYQRYFTPFAFDVNSVRSMLLRRGDDSYWGIWLGDELAAFFMLRGFDQGYEVPSFGVSVAQRFSRRGLLKLSLQFAVAWSRLNGLSRLMLKVDTDNRVAKREYERCGFLYDHTEPSGKMVYYLDLETKS